MKVTKRQIKRIIREEYNRIRQEQRIVTESYFKDLLVDIEDHLLYLADSHAGNIPMQMVVRPLKRKFKHFSRMTDASVLAELMDMQPYFSEIRIVGDNIISY